MSGCCKLKRASIFGLIAALTVLQFECSHNSREGEYNMLAREQSEMVYVSGGKFLMGASNEAPSFCEPSEKPIHVVYLDRFWIDKYEVTNSRYRQCVRAGKCQPPHFDDGECILLDGEKWQKGVLPESFRGASQPVVCVDWRQAQDFCEWEGKRLPTEAEWEKAARGTDARLYPWGDEWKYGTANFCDISCKLRWRDATFNDGFEFTAPVGSFPLGASPYGVYDMAGNVWEWTADWYDERCYERSGKMNPTCAERGDYRVVRGGSWHLDPPQLRTTNRKTALPTESFSYLGFRCVR